MQHLDAPFALADGNQFLPGLYGAGQGPLVEKALNPYALSRLRVTTNWKILDGLMPRYMAEIHTKMDYLHITEPEKLIRQAIAGKMNW